MAKIFILDSTSKSMTASTVLGSSTIDFVTTWADSTSTTFAEGSQDGQITSDTAVTIVASPASSTKRVVKSINFFNRGTDTQTINLNFVNSSNVRRVAQITLAASQSWSLDDMVSGAAVTTVTPAASYKNFLINGNFEISQRTKPGTAATYTAATDFKSTQGAYTHDRWFVLSSLSDGSTTTFPASLRSIGLDVAQGTSGESIQGSTVSKTSCILRGIGMPVSKFGIAQIIDTTPSGRLGGQQVTLSFRAKASSTSGTKFPTIRGAILTTTSSFTRTFVSAWNSYLTDPTLNGISSTGAVGTSAVATFTGSSPTGTALSTSWQTYTVNATIASGNTARIAAFIWVETDGTTTLTSTDEVYIQDVQLEIGSTATSFENISTANNLARCQEYTYATYGIAGRQTSYGSGVWQLTGTGNAQSFVGVVNLPVKMRATPSVSFSTNVQSVVTDVLTTTIAATSTTSLTVASATIFPDTSVSSTNYFLRFPTSLTAFETVKVTAKSSGSKTLTVTRGQAGSTATASVPVGTIISGVTLLNTAIASSGAVSTITTQSTVLLPTPAESSVQYILIGGEIFSYATKANSTQVTLTVRSVLGTTAAAASTNAIIQPIVPFENHFNLLATYGDANPIYFSGISGSGASQTQVNVTLPRRLQGKTGFFGSNTLIDGGFGNGLGLSYIVVNAEI